MRYTHKLEEPEGNCNYFLIPDREQCDNAENKLGQLEDLMEKYDIKTLSQVEGSFIGFVTDYTEEGRNHIGQLLKLEEDLGIGLDTLYELLVRGCYYKCDNEILYTFGDVDVSNKNIHNAYNKELLFQDYGKTWALTKEELE